MEREIAEEINEIAGEAVEGWLDDGAAPDAAIDRLALAVDLAVDFEAILGPVGALVEAHDEAIARAILGRLKALVHRLRPDPDRLRERAARAAAKGRPRVAARRLARAARLEVG